MSYTLAAAAAATGLNKTTVLRAIKSGKISGTRNELGEWHVEPAELHRVYPAVTGRSAAAADASETTHRYATPFPDAELRLRASLAEQRLQDLKDKLAEMSQHHDSQLAELRAQRDDMREQRDKWQSQAERLALPGPAARSWWRRRAG